MSYDKRAYEYARENYYDSKKLQQPANDAYNQYYGKAFGNAYDTAMGLDNNSPLYSGYNLAQDDLRKRMARQGMGQSGAMNSAGRGLFNAYSQQAGQQGLQRSLAKEQALAGLAGQSLSGAATMQNGRQNAANLVVGTEMQRAGAQSANNAAQQGAIGNLIGADIGLAGNITGMMLGDPQLGSQMNSLFKPITNDYGMGNSQQAYNNTSGGLGNSGSFTSMMY